MTLNKINKKMVTGLEEDLGNITTQLAQTAKKDEVQSLVVNKAEISYVDTLAASLASGSPKGTYATLSALRTAFPTGNSNIYVVTADGNWYYWNASDWISGGVYQSTGLLNGSVDPTKTTFAIKSPNLFNKKTITDGVTLDQTTGNELVDPLWVTSQPIPLSAISKTFKRSHISRVAAYDSQGKLRQFWTAGNGTFTTSISHSYIKVSIRKRELDVYQLEEGSITTEYRPYQATTIDKVYVKSENLSPIISGFNNYTTNYTYTNGLLTKVTTLYGDIVVSETTLNYTNGLLISIVKVEEGKTLTTTLIRGVGNLSGKVTSTTNQLQGGN